MTSPPENEPAADDGPLPSVETDEETPLGDSPDLHDEITAHDLPLDHPGRQQAEEKAGDEGTTRGNT